MTWETILAIDPWSNKFWIAIFKDWRLLHSEQVYMNDIVKNMHVDAKPYFFWKKLRQLKKEFKLTKMIYEKSHAHYTTISKIWEMIWIIRYFSTLYWLDEVEWFSTATTKKYITWYWKSSKQEMIEAVSKRFKLKEVDEDESDAIALWAYYQEWILWNRIIVD